MENATVDDFKEFFTGYETQAINVPVNPRTLRPLGYAFVTLPNAVEAWRAFAELNGKPLLERKISVQIARTDPNGAPLARQTRPRSFSPGASESFLNSGRVTPAPPASGIYTLEQPPLYVPQVHDISATVCVRNLPVPTQSTDTDTDTLFALRGYLVRNIDTYVSFRTAEPYYYAFVTLRDAAEAQRAVAQFNNREWGGSSIVVEPADVRTWPRFNGPGPHNDGIEPAPPPAVEYDDITAEVNARLAATQQRKREARARKRERKRKRMSADSVISNPATDNGDYQFVPPLRKRPRQFWGGSTPVYPQDEEHGRLSPVDSYTPHRAAKRELDDDGYGALRSESPAAKRIKVEPV
ncbi:hypothetical protein H2199_006652 [Coniosporium tulheliwenetii]|uniref:Uncharacterized protein n=1 Tax=Coniosporium tulheliwenetii TaxID=3383036 RepID=A0ACC2YTX4_9PEZI|nr:hypothetical protein H2199_006652 [Cladosporium sp. JES 115]